MFPRFPCTCNERMFCLCKPLTFEYVLHELCHGVTLTDEFGLWPFEVSKHSFQDSHRYAADLRVGLSAWLTHRFDQMKAADKHRSEAQALAVEIEVLKLLRIPYDRAELLRFASKGQGGSLTPKRLGALIGAYVRSGEQKKKARKVIRLLEKENGRCPRP